MKTLFRAALAAAALASSPVLAQEAAVQNTAAGLPTCAETGALRVAVSIPPGMTEQETAARIQEAKMFVEGTRVVYIPTGRLPRMRNARQFSERFEALMDGFLRENRSVDGNASVLMKVNADGVVEEATSNTGNRMMDRRMERLWMGVQFEPLVLGGCRARAWLQTPFRFSSDYSGDWNEMRVSPTAP